MKPTILLFAIILCSFYQANSQGFIVNYEETIKSGSLTSDLIASAIDDPQARAILQNSYKDKVSKTTSQLLVNNGVSLYTLQQASNQSTQNVDNENTSGSMSLQISIPPQTMYKNRDNNQRLTQTTFFKKEYLIEEPLTKYNWEIGEKTEMIAGYQCIEATMIRNNGTKVTAWYAPDIPINDGPHFYWGLPGLILYLDVDGGRHIYSCTSIEQPDDLLAINAPVEGEKVSRAQYNKIVDDTAQANNGTTDVSGPDQTKRSVTTIIRR